MPNPSSSAWLNETMNNPTPPRYQNNLMIQRCLERLGYSMSQVAPARDFFGDIRVPGKNRRATSEFSPWHCQSFIDACSCLQGFRDHCVNARGGFPRVSRLGRCVHTCCMAQGRFKGLAPASAVSLQNPGATWIQLGCKASRI